MKKTRFTEEQMVTILREADEKAVPEVAKKHGISSQTIYGWRKHFGTLEPADIKRLRQLEQENGRLKRIVADRDLEIDVLKEITRKKWFFTALSTAPGDSGNAQDHERTGSDERSPTSVSAAASGRHACPARA